MGVMLLGKMKIHELAKEIDKTSKEIIAVAQELGLEVKSHMSSLEEKDIEMPEFINENEHMKELWTRFDGTSEIILRFRKKLVEEYLKIKKKNTKEEREKYV